MWKGFFILLFIMTCLSPDCFSNEEKRPGDHNTISFYLENDVLNHTDAQYTSGIKLTWMSKNLNDYCDTGAVPGLVCHTIEKIPFMNNQGFQKNISFSMGQNIYTPNDTTRKDLIKDDRPYAGISYLALGFISKNQKRMDALEIDAGIVGPHSYAEKMQFFFHRLIGSQEAKGWSNQLKDEPILDLIYERNWKAAAFNTENGFGYDFIPRAGFSIGNFLIAASIGAEMRIGFNIPNDFGTYLIGPCSDTNTPLNDKDPRISSDHSHFGIHFFMGFDGSAIARDLLLDGNTIADSHSVDKKPFIHRYFGGVGVLINRFKITYANVKESKNFSTQKRGENYGSLTVSYSY